MIKKFNRLTEDEFVLLKGTDKMVNMISVCVCVCGRERERERA